MKIVRDMREYLFKDELEINVYLDKVDIVNYKELGEIDNNKITIYYDNGKITINGSNLTISKLLNNEVLIIGKINNVELGG